MNTTEEIVSVPYRGYSFFNLRKFKNLNVNIKNIEFPSLTGVIRFLIIGLIFLLIDNQPVSVPYRGYSFFNPTLESPHGYWAQNTFCGAKLFLIGNY